MTTNKKRPQVLTARQSEGEGLWLTCALGTDSSAESEV